MKVKLEKMAQSHSQVNVTLADGTVIKGMIVHKLGSWFVSSYVKSEGTGGAVDDIPLNIADVVEVKEVA